MRATILVDSPAVWASVQADLAGARKYAYIQTYSFDGDRVGTALAKALLAAEVPDRRLLVDSYSRANQGDRWIPLPGTLFDREFRADVSYTQRLVQTLRAQGVGTRFGRPFGFLWHRALHRDHKKLILFDDRVAYLGGVNFSAHNFAWHDLMVRIEDREVTKFLRRDFVQSWEGRSKAATASFPELGLDLYSLAGRGNREAFRRLLDLIDGAMHSIHVVSPYLSPPFTHHLAAAAKRGVKVRILTPLHNNKQYLHRYLLAEASRSGFEVWLFEDRMSHMKCMLIDDTTLIAGSCNFDLMSYQGFFAEVIAVFRSPALVRAFHRQVIEPDIAASKPFEGGDEPDNGGLGRTLRTLPIQAANLLARALRPRP